MSGLSKAIDQVLTGHRKYLAEDRVNSFPNWRDEDGILHIKVTDQDTPNDGYILEDKVWVEKAPF